MEPSNARRRLDRALWIGPVALLVTACAWSVLDAEFSTDTWLGLAAGRQLFEQLDWSRFRATFPAHDTFSYTFYGQPWFNQNWLSNLGQYWIHHRAGPTAVVAVTWAIAACVLALVLLAVRWRSESWLAAWLAAAIVGVGGRDFLEPRAAIVGLLCLAAMWALISAIEGQRDRRRWWPIALLLPVLVLWSNAHGGFVFGFGLLALYVCHWAAVRFGARFGVRFGTSGVAASGMQVVAIAAVLATAIALALTLGPFGVASFAHPGRIASSAVFRTVSEWQPAYSRIGSAYPPMWRFWAIAGLTASGLLLLWLVARIATATRARSAALRELPPWSLYDVAVVLIALAMTLWARRFAPLLYVLSAPVLAVGVVRMGASLTPTLRGHAVLALKLSAALAAVVTGWLTWTAAQRDLIAAFAGRPGTGLLERSRGYPALDDAARFVGENGLRANVFAEYGYGGSVMFHAPLARVFIDGRSDQLYGEQHFRNYWALVDGRAPDHVLLQRLAESGTDAVLASSRGSTIGLHDALLFSTDWVAVLVNPDFTLFLRRGSRALRQLAGLAREGREWRPAHLGAVAADAEAARANVLLSASPADSASALERLEAAVEREPRLGRVFYPAIARALVDNAGDAAAAEYVVRELRRVTFDRGLDAATRPELLATLAQALARIARAEGDGSGSAAEIPHARGGPLRRERPPGK